MRTFQPSAVAACLTPSPTSVQIATGQVWKVITLFLGIATGTFGGLYDAGSSMIASRSFLAPATLMPDSATLDVDVPPALELAPPAPPESFEPPQPATAITATAASAPTKQRRIRLP